MDASSVNMIVEELQTLERTFRIGMAIIVIVLLGISYTLEKRGE